MKLRNKKTGEIGYPYFQNWKEISCVIVDENAIQIAEYTSLAKLNEEWEDYEEPKVYYYISDFGAIRGCEIGKFPEDEEDRKQIGNYFSSREEAEKAVEKLKAWKLLKDECDIKFDGIIRDDKAMLKAVKLSYDRHQVTFDRMRECMDALHLLFGGEE
jgi:hypothetical protein